MKFSGKIGFYIGNEEVRPGIYREKIIEKSYKGDIDRQYRKFQTTSDQNDTLIPNNIISIYSDLFSRQNWDSIRYVVWNSKKLKVTSVEIGFPKIILTIGGAYDGADKIISS